MRKIYPLLLILLVILSCNLVKPSTPASPTTTVSATTPTIPPTRIGPDVTREASSIQGSVEWEAGRCCAGGQADETIQLQADFEAESVSGGVKQLRAATGGMCFDEAKMANAGWEPFVPSKEYPFRVALNWVGFYISVQYRDNQGNISPIYCDDISVEGAPASP